MKKHPLKMRNSNPGELPHVTLLRKTINHGFLKRDVPTAVCEKVETRFYHIGSAINSLVGTIHASLFNAIRITRLSRSNWPSLIIASVTYPVAACSRSVTKSGLIYGNEWSASQMCALHFATVFYSDIIFSPVQIAKNLFCWRGGVG